MIHLEHKGIKIATLEVVESDQPWHYCEFTPSNNFNDHKKFFEDFQKEYQSHEVEDWDKHFGKLISNGYKLVSGDRKCERFTLLFEGSHVRLRGQFVKTT